MEKLQAIDVLARHRADAVTVATMQAAAPWKDRGQTVDSHLHVDASGCMGSASSIGLGIAIGAPDRRVIVLDGDGSLLMQLGSLVTIGARAPRNFYHVVFSNGLYESSGNQPVPGQGRFDFAALAVASGYREARRFATAEDLDEALPDLLTRDGPILIDLAIARDDRPPRWPGVPMAGQVKALKERLGSQ